MGFTLDEVMHMYFGQFFDFVETDREMYEKSIEKKEEPEDSLMNL